MNYYSIAYEFEKMKQLGIIVNVLTCRVVSKIMIFLLVGQEHHS